jgi:hypothetical protein
MRGISRRLEPICYQVINRKQFKGDHVAGKGLTLMELAGLLSLDMNESAKVDRTWQRLLRPIPTGR